MDINFDDVIQLLETYIKDCQNKITNHLLLLLHCLQSNIKQAIHPIY